MAGKRLFFGRKTGRGGFRLPFLVDRLLNSARGKQPSGEVDGHIKEGVGPLLEAVHLADNSQRLGEVHGAKPGKFLQSLEGRLRRRVNPMADRESGHTGLAAKPQAPPRMAKVMTKFLEQLGRGIYLRPHGDKHHKAGIGEIFPACDHHTPGFSLGRKRYAVAMGLLVVPASYGVKVPPSPEADGLSCLCRLGEVLRCDPPSLLGVSSDL
jgi:hypothetical protein